MLGKVRQTRDSECSHIFALCAVIAMFGFSQRIPQGACCRKLEGIGAVPHTKLRCTTTEIKIHSFARIPYMLLQDS